MQRMTILLVACAALLATASDALSQQRPVLSPRDSVFLSLDTNVISVTYGRPSMRGRKIMGQLVPWNQVWRTGANQATHLKTSFDMVFGGVPVTRGRYTLWTIPSPSGWKVVINKQTDQWGTAYDASQDLARFDARVEQLPSPVDTFTVVLQARGKTAGVMKMMWENTLVSVPFEKSDRIRPLSPPDSAEVFLDGKKVSIKYSRPFMRGRTIWGAVVPYDSVWRAGANLVTALATETDLKIGGVTVPKGSYTLYAIATSNAVTLIISRKLGGGLPAYDPKMDLARINMKVESPAGLIDPFRIWFDTAGSSGAVLKLGWADRICSVAITPG